MKLIYIEDFDDCYSATKFKRKYKEVTNELYEKVKKFGYFKYKGKSIKAQALEFSDTDKDFILWVKIKFVDEDFGKHTNFFVVE